MSPFLPERGNYFQRKEQGGVALDDGNDKQMKFPYPLHSEYLDLEGSKNAKKQLAPDLGVFAGITYERLVLGYFEPKLWVFEPKLWVF